MLDTGFPAHARMSFEGADLDVPCVRSSFLLRLLTRSLLPFDGWYSNDDISNDGMFKAQV